MMPLPIESRLYAAPTPIRARTNDDTPTTPSVMSPGVQPSGITLNSCASSRKNISNADASMPIPSTIAARRAWS
jgi:hypothetical protein